MQPFKAIRNKHGIVSLPGEMDYIENLSADDIEAAMQDADKIEWHDIVTMYDDDELDFSDMDCEPDEGLHPDETVDSHDNQLACHPDEEELANLTDEPSKRCCPQCGSAQLSAERRMNGNTLCHNGHTFPSASVVTESLSASQRSKRRLIFARGKARRRMSMKIALHRQSTPMKLQKRSKAMARRILTKKILHGRKRSQMSAQEKDRLEKMLKTASPTIARIAQRVMPRIRMIEQSRLRHKGKKRKTYESALPPEAFNNVEGPVTIPTPEDIRIMNTQNPLLKKVRQLRSSK